MMPTEIISLPEELLIRKFFLTGVNGWKEEGGYKKSLASKQARLQSNWSENFSIA